MREFLPPDRSINQFNYDPSVYDGVKEMYLSGMSIPKIAKKMKMFNSRIWKYLRRENVQLRPRSVRMEKYDEVAKMRTEGITMAEICRRTGLKLANVQSALRIRGVQTSSRPCKGREPIEHRRARVIATAALSDNRLERKPCEVCAEHKSQAHHDDYNFPLAVRWLCQKHHTEWHRSNTPIPYAVAR